MKKTSTMKGSVWREKAETVSEKGNEKGNEGKGEGKGRELGNKKRRWKYLRG